MTRRGRPADPADRPPPSLRLCVRVTGVVQGVGFRPYVYRLARELGVVGWVLNDARGVLAEVQGPSAVVEAFLERLPREAPPLASVEAVESHEVPPGTDASFEIVTSAAGEAPSALVSPDAATCDDCLRELLDPGDRRFRYPFINCTNCGPRFTIVRGIPYDRPFTTMAGFIMCAACQAEYSDPGNRRFHAQPNACPVCGPTVALRSVQGPVPLPPAARDAVEAAAWALRDGAVVAVKGLGGYHLACRADDEAVVAALRGRKHREDKAFALMAPDLDGARALVHLRAGEERLLTSRQRPIVLARRRAAARVAPSVAPGHRDLGVMLPYSPLHHLLLADAGCPLVFTSGNVSDEPIAFRDDEALERLAAIADLFLVHDRPIETRTDDSVVRTVDVAGESQTLILRRSRGWVPAPEEASVAAPRPILACGGHLKNTFALARGRRVWVGPHIGDLENVETLGSFEQGIAHLERLFELAPEVVAHDLHPDYLSTRYALERAEAEGLVRVAVQHHHAHLAACLAEHGETGPALGAIYDGTGYGLDGTVWGGELLLGDLAEFQRVGHLWPVRLPGGEMAVRQPWRMACAWMGESERDTSAPPPHMGPGVAPSDWRNVARLARSGVASPVTTSMGRLFDAVSALCGVRLQVRHEGQAAMELEMAAGSAGVPAGYPLPYRVPDHDGPGILDARATVRAVLDDLEGGVPVAEVAARFHEGIAAGTVRACRVEAERRGVATVVLSGGVFQNVRLLERTAALLAASGLRPLVPRRLPPGDGGLAYGQAVSAAARLSG